MSQKEKYNQFLRILEDIELYVVGGEGAKAQEWLKKINTQACPRPLALKLANLFRRSQLPLRGIRVLKPIVRNELDFVEQASIQEISEYAICLLRAGAKNEARELVDSHESENSSYFLTKAHILIAQWNYEEAVGWLKKYLASEGLSEYEKLVGQVNLAASYVYLSDPAAIDILLPLLEKLKVEKKKLLRGNVLELLALVAFNKKDFLTAKAYLGEAKQLLNTSNTLSDFFVKKWLTLLNIYQNPSMSLSELTNVKNLALKFGNWETLRDCDFHLGVALKDDPLLNKVYAGTPYASYRKKIVGIHQSSANLDSFVYKGSEKIQYILKLSDFSMSGKELLKIGGLIHKLVNLMFSDFYHPKRVGSIFDELFKGEFFDPYSSPNRVHQLVNRAKDHLREHNIGVEIVQIRNSYHFRVKENWGVSLNLHSEDLSRDRIFYYKLWDKFSTGEFTKQQACALLNISLPTFHRFYKRLEENSLIEKLGQSRSTRYKLLANLQKKAS